MLVIGLAAGRKGDTDLHVLGRNCREGLVALQVEDAARLAVADVDGRKFCRTGGRKRDCRKRQEADDGEKQCVEDANACFALIFHDALPVS